MNIATVLLVFVVAWWLVFFAVLPWGVRSQHETEEGVTEGTEPGAPANPNLKKKIIVTTLIAIFLTTAYYLVATSGWISFRN